MSRRTTFTALATGALTLVLMSAAVAQERCVPISGTIVNNFTSPISTLGVVSLVYGPQKRGAGTKKLQCALSGLSNVVPPVDGEINYTHSISCDDAISMPAGDGSGAIPVHSSIVLYTTGTIGAPAMPTQEFTFTEVSVPILAAPARGLFYGVTGGQLLVEGAVYKSPVAGVPGSIDMKFKGEVCYGG